MIYFISSEKTKYTLTTHSLQKLQKNPSSAACYTALTASAHLLFQTAEAQTEY